MLVGGYAVCFHGHYRTTGDIDIWIGVSPDNAAKMVRLIREFGFESADLVEEVFLRKDRIIRMGVEPTRIEILTGISGCEFADCYPRRVRATVDEVELDLISLPDLLRNKLKAGRLKDLDDAQKLG